MAKEGMFGAKKGPETKQTTYTTAMSPEQRRLFRQAINLYGQQLGQNLNVYQGARVAPFGGLQSKVFDWADQGGFMISPEQVGSYYRDVIKKPAQKTYREETAPAISEAYSGPGYWGSTRSKAQMEGAQDLQDYLNTQWGKLNWDVLDYNRQGALQQFQLGAAEQQQRQNEINAAIQKFAEENQITDPQNLDIIFKLLGMDVAGRQTTSAATTTPSWHTGDWTRLGTQVALSIFGGPQGQAIAGFL